MVRASVVGRVWGPYCPAWSARASSAASGDLRAFRTASRLCLLRVDRARALPRVLSARRARMDWGKTRGGGEGDALRIESHMCLLRGDRARALARVVALARVPKQAFGSLPIQTKMLGIVQKATA